MEEKAKKKICILRSNPVNPDSRVEKEAEALLEAGYEVHVLCWDRESDHPERVESIHAGRIRVHRLGFQAAYGAGMKSLRPYLGFQFAMIRWIRSHGKAYDAFHACDFDTAFFSYPAVRRAGAAFVFDIFDFICGEPKNLMQRMVKKSQLALIDRSDMTIICTEQRKKQIEGSHPKKLLVIHNSPDASMVRTAPDIPVDKTRTSVVYVGILAENRLLREMAHYFAVHSGIDFYVAGFGRLEPFFKEMARQYPNIRFLGKLGYAAALGLEEQCDLMTSIYDPAIENHRYAASNKLYESLMLGKPVIVVEGTGMSRIVEENGIGATIDYSEAGFAAGMEKLLGMREQWQGISEKMKRIYRAQYDWDIMKKRLVAGYEELLG